MELSLLADLLPFARVAAELLWWLLPSTLQEMVLWQFVYLPLLLAAVYPIAIQYERGGWWRLLLPLTAAVALLDVWLNWTTFSLYLASAPRKREYTLSQHLERLVLDPGWRGYVARAGARFTNRFDPTPPHITLP